MSNPSKKKTSRRSLPTPATTDNEQPRSLAVAARGIRTSQDVKDLMANIMCDVIGNKLTPSVANATCNATGKLLKTVEMEYRYGRQLANGERVLALTEGIK